MESGLTEDKGKAGSTSTNIRSGTRINLNTILITGANQRIVTGGVEENIPIVFGIILKLTGRELAKEVFKCIIASDTCLQESDCVSCSLAVNLE